MLALILIFQVLIFAWLFAMRKGQKTMADQLAQLTSDLADLQATIDAVSAGLAFGTIGAG